MQKTTWQSLKAKMICSKPFPAEEFVVTVISLAITGINNRNSCRGIVCVSHTICKLKDKHPELGKSVSETQKMLTVLSKNKKKKSNDLLDAVLGSDLGEQRCFKILIRQFVSLNKNVPVVFVV